MEKPFIQKSDCIFLKNDFGEVAFIGILLHDRKILSFLADMGSGPAWMQAGCSIELMEYLIRTGARSEKIFKILQSDLLKLYSFRRGIETDEANRVIDRAAENEKLGWRYFDMLRAKERVDVNFFKEVITPRQWALYEKKKN